MAWDLKTVLVDYKSIAEAPSFSDIERRFTDESKLDEFMQQEARVEYKAIDSAGNVYLMQNPALVQWRQRRGEKPWREPPKLVKHISKLEAFTAQQSSTWEAAKAPEKEAPKLAQEQKALF